MNITVKKINELKPEEKREIKELILNNFQNSRLNTYENIYYYRDNDKIIGVVGVYFINKYFRI